MPSLLAALCIAAAPAADLTPKPYETEIAQLVASMLADVHYAERPVDDALSADWFDRWLDALDYQRVYLLAADVDEFRARRTALDDAVRAGRPDLALAHAMFERMTTRVQERVTRAIAMVGTVDVTDAETTVLDRHEAGLPFAPSAEALDVV